MYYELAAQNSKPSMVSISNDESFKIVDKNINIFLEKIQEIDLPDILETSDDGDIFEENIPSKLGSSSTMIVLTASDMRELCETKLKRLQHRNSIVTRRKPTNLRREILINNTLFNIQFVTQPHFMEFKF